MHGSLADSSYACKEEMVYCWGGEVQRRKPRLNTQEGNCEQGLTAAADLGEARHKPAFDKPLRFWGDLLQLCVIVIWLSSRGHARFLLDLGGWRQVGDIKLPQNSQFQRAVEHILWGPSVFNALDSLDAEELWIQSGGAEIQSDNYFRKLKDTPFVRNPYT